MGRDFRRFGPTGRYPHGKLNEYDEGELQMGVTADRQQRTVILAFGKPVAWLGLTPEVARALAQSLIEKADDAAKSSA